MIIWGAQFLFEEEGIVFLQNIGINTKSITSSSQTQMLYGDKIKILDQIDFSSLSEENRNTLKEKCIEFEKNIFIFN